MCLHVKFHSGGDRSHAHLRLRDEGTQHGLVECGVVPRRLRRKQQSGALRGVAQGICILVKLSGKAAFNGNSSG